MDLLTSPHLLRLLASPQEPVCGYFSYFLCFVFLFKCVFACALAILLEYSGECWGEALTIWSLLPALHNKNRHTSTPFMDDKETGT